MGSFSDGVQAGHGVYVPDMSKKQKPLIETNPFLKDPKQYRKAMRLSVASSIAVETGTSVKSVIRMLSLRRRGKQSKKLRGSPR